MISLVMAVRDGRAWLERALRSITRHTRGDLDIVLVDNASGPETREYLRGVAARVIWNERNRGCAGAWNQGIAAARGGHVCLVNSDIEVPDGWLERLAAFHRGHAFAWVSPAIREGPLDYDLEAWNRAVRARTADRHCTGEFRGMVLYSRRDLYDRLGPFDERYECAKYEDEDMFWRLRRAGLDAAVTTSVVVHHHGSLTVRAERRRSPGFEARNKTHFDHKWRALRLARQGRKLHLRLRHLAWLLRYRVSY